MSTTYFWPLLRLVALLLCVATVAGFAGRGGWLLDLASDFRLQYLLLLALLSLFFLIGKKGAMMLLTAAFALANLWPVASLHLPSTPKPASGKGVGILYATVGHEPRQIDSLAALAHGTGVDIVALCGVDAAGLARLRERLPAFRYQQSYPREDIYGVAILSRHRIDGGRIATVGRSKSPVAIARCEITGGVVTIVVARTFEGWGSGAWEERNAQLADIGTAVSGERGDVVLVGSLGLTPWSPWFADLLARSRLTDGRKEAGVMATEPLWLGSVGVPRHHLLHGSGVAVDGLRALSTRWSEHRPLVANIRRRSIERGTAAE